MHFKKTSKLVNFGAAILILKMEENVQYFCFDVWCMMLYYFKEGKNITEMQKKKRSVQCVEKVLWLVESVKSGLRSFVVLLTIWPNNSLLWGCLLHWEMSSSTLGLCPLEANSMGRSSARLSQIPGAPLLSYHPPSPRGRQLPGLRAPGIWCHLNSS